MVQMGATHAFIARTFGCSHVAVTNLMQHYRQTGQTSDTPDIRHTKNKHTQSNIPWAPVFATLHLRNRFLTVTSSGHRVSQQTVARWLGAHGIRAYRSHRDHCYLRLRWAITVWCWQPHDEQRVVFTVSSQLTEDSMFIAKEENKLQFLCVSGAEKDLWAG